MIIEKKRVQTPIRFNLTSTPSGRDLSQENYDLTNDLTLMGEALAIRDHYLTRIGAEVLELAAKVLQLEARPAPFKGKGKRPARQPLVKARPDVPVFSVLPPRVRRYMPSWYEPFAPDLKASPAGLYRMEWASPARLEKEPSISVEGSGSEGDGVLADHKPRQRQPPAPPTRAP